MAKIYDLIYKLRVFHDVKDATISPPPDFPYCCISVTRSDKLKVILGDAKAWSIIQGVISKYIGFRRVKSKNGVLSVTVVGYPFREGQGTQDSVLMKMMSVDLMQTLYRVGWVLVLGSNLSRSDGMVSWFYRKKPADEISLSTEPSPLPAPGSSDCGSHFAENFLVIGLSSSDAFQIINAPKPITDSLVEITRQWYRFGVKSVRSVLYDNVVVKLNGNPWMSQNVDKLAGQLLVLHLISHLESLGYTYYGSGDLKGTTDALFFRLSTTDSDSGSSETKSQTFHYLMLALEDQDRLALINTTQTIINSMRKILTRYWQHGLKEEGQRLCSYEFILHGNPWWSEGADAVLARKVLAYIFDELSCLGYAVMSTLDMSRNVGDKSAFVLKAIPHAPQESITPMKHICISMSSEDKLRLIHFTTKPLLMAIRNAIAIHWPNGISEEGKNYDAYEIRLDGCPWSGAHPGDAARARTLMTQVLAKMEQLGWHIVSSADVSAKYHAFESSTYPLDVDSWYLAKPMSEVVQEKSESSKSSSKSSPASNNNSGHSNDIETV